MMNVDKFGRHENALSRDVLRGPKGEGFQLTHDGNYDMKRKRLSNLADAVENDDSVNLKVLRSMTLNFDTDSNVFNAKNKRIVNIDEPSDGSDAVNRTFVLNEIGKLKRELEQTIKAMEHKFSSSSVTETRTDTSEADKNK